MWLFITLPLSWFHLTVQTCCNMSQIKQLFFSSACWDFISADEVCVVFLVWKWGFLSKFQFLSVCFYVVFLLFIMQCMVFAGVIVLLSLAFLMPAFYYIPKASLAAVIICAVAPMVDYRLVAKMWRIRSKCLPSFFFLHVCLPWICLLQWSHSHKSSTELDLLPFIVTFLMSFWQVQYGILGGVAVSGALLLYNIARPQIKVT